MTLGVCHHAGKQNPDIRTGRHVAHNLHAHVVFVTTYRRDVCDDAMSNAVKRSCMGSVFWSRSYFAGSCDGAPLTLIRQYIEGQKHPL
jgi:putative transposase